jgi:hypothetical protein
VQWHSSFVRGYEGISLIIIILGTPKCRISPRTLVVSPTFFKRWEEIYNMGKS